MNEPAFDQIDACVFDAYGTLFDVHSAVAQGGAALGEKAQAVSALWRQKQLEYTWLRSLMKTHVDFWRPPPYLFPRFNSGRWGGWCLRG